MPTAATLPWLRRLPLMERVSPVVARLSMTPVGALRRVAPDWTIRLLLSLPKELSEVVSRRMVPALTAPGRVVRLASPQVVLPSTHSVTCGLAFSTSVLLLPTRRSVEAVVAEAATATRTVVRGGQ